MTTIKLDKQVRKALEDAGAVYIRKNKHHIFRLSNGRTVSISATTSDHRAVQNQLRDIRRGVNEK